MSAEVQFRILGSVGVTVDDVPMPIGAPRQRALLAMLLLDANRPVHPHTLIEGIWGDAVPQHPEGALQIVVSRLRNALGVAAPRLLSDAAGYRILAGVDELDHSRAQRSFHAARELWKQHDFIDSAEAADEALACWTSEGLSDLREVPFYEAAHRQLRELHFAIYELRNRAYLSSGRHVEVLADIDSWVQSEPWRERTRAHQMVALYRAGRRVDALAAYEDLRQRLREDLGVDPSDFMLDLHERIAAQDPTLLARRAGIAAPLPHWTDAVLPFVGRSREELVIFDCLREVAAGATKMILVEGVAGIGKSRLVLEAARRASDEAIVLAVDGADALRPGLHAIANALFDASTRLSDRELRMCLGNSPGDVAEMVPTLRRRLPDLPSPLEADDELRAARLRAGLASWLGALSKRTPVVLLLDDVHRAGPALLLFLGALLGDEAPQRVLVLATARSGLADHSSRLEQLARSVDKLGRLERLEIQGLSPDQVERLLVELAVPDAASRAPALALSTSGHPYLLREILQDPDAAASFAGNGSTDASARVREYVLRRVAAMSEPAARLLNIAAAMDGPFDLSMLAEICRLTSGSTGAMVDEAISAGLVHVAELGWFDFVHDLARRAVAESVDPCTRAATHRAIAEMLERREARPALVASQWNRAAGDDADAKAQSWSELAGEAALGDLDPHAAATWFGVAADRAGDERTRARLLIRLAGAQCLTFDDARHQTLREAVEIARRLDDDELLVGATQLPTPIWASMPALTRRERLFLLAEASARVVEPALRTKLMARRASELILTGDWLEARSLASNAIDAARISGDDSVLVEVLLRHSQTTCTPHNLAERTANVEEALTLAGRGHDPVQRFYTLTAAASVAVEAARMDEADLYCDAALVLGDQLDVAQVNFSVECMRGWRAALAGDFDEAERFTMGAADLGTHHGIENAGVGPALQLGWIRWQQGRFAELLPLLDDPDPENPVALILAARARAALRERRDDAAATLARAAAHDFDDLPMNLFWSNSLVAAAETAFIVGDPRAGAALLALLAPFADQSSWNGCWAVMPLAYAAGMAAAVAGDERADELFEHSIVVAERLRAPVLRARAEVAWSRVLLGRGEFAGRVIPMLDAASVTLLHHDVKSLATSADRMRRFLQEAVAG